MPRPEGGFIYSVATANVLDRATLWEAVSYGIGKHVELAEATGYHGIEVWPQRPDIAWEMKNEVQPKDLSKITSAHQSPRSHFRLDLSNGIVPVIKELQVVTFLPEINASLGSLEGVVDQVRKNDGYELPVVLYKEAQDYLSNRRIKDKRIQTDPETATAWGVTNAQEYVDNAFKRGFTSIVIDTHHIRHADVITGQENPLRDWRTSIPVLLPHVKELHVGAGRIDFGNADEKQIMEELEDLMTGGMKNTEVVQMLRFIADQDWKGLIVLELRPSAVKKLLGHFSEKDLAMTYERIRATLFNIFDK